NKKYQVADELVLGHRKDGYTDCLMRDGKYARLIRTDFDDVHEIVGSINLHLIQEKPKNIWEVLYGELNIADITKFALEEIGEAVERGGGYKINEQRIIKGEGNWTNVRSASACYSGKNEHSLVEESVITVLDRKDENSPYHENSKWLIRHIQECDGDEYIVYKDGKYFETYLEYSDAYSAFTNTSY